MNLHSLMLFPYISSFLALSLAATYNITSMPKVSAKEPPTQLSINQLQQRTKSITVKVLSEKSWGSGVVIKRQGQIYTVLTNQHVLDAGKRYRVQTTDGRTYQANLLPKLRSNDDLGLLQFRSPNFAYTVASLKSSSRLVVGERVFAAGFPSDVTNPSSSGKFEFTTGQITILLKRPFVGGYQIGYTNDVKRGMSGGPLLNRRGEVVGVNGMPKYPLLGNPYVFKDGSTISDTMWEEVIGLSWAVPSQTFLNLKSSLSTSINFSAQDRDAVDYKKSK